MSTLGQQDSRLMNPVIAIWFARETAQKSAEAVGTALSAVQSMSACILPRPPTAIFRI